MTTSNETPQTNSSSAALENDRLNKFILASLAFHAALFVVFAVRAFFLPSAPLQLERAIRVDIVALPDKPIATLPPIAEAPQPEVKQPESAPPVAKVDPPKPETAKPKIPPKTEPNKINLNKTKKEQAAALKRLNAIEKLKRMAESPAPSNTKSASPQKSPTAVKGNEVSAGNSLTGLSKIEHDNYTELVHDQVKRHWNLPQWMASANLSAVVRVFVNSRGSLVKKELVRSSKNSVFDQSAMTAVDAAIPLPQPPAHLVSLIEVRGIDIEFVPSEN